MADSQTKDAPETDEQQEERKPLKLEVKIDSPSACQRHITVKISHEDVERYFDQAFGEMMPDAQVPGFRAGRAPRKLVEHRFRKEVKDQVKSSLLMDAMAQISEDNKLAAISEPDLNLAAVEIPDDGPMTFEFDIEVRPEFDLPQWKGLSVERPTREFTEKDVDQQLKQLLSRRGKLVPHEGKAELGDYLSVNITFKDGEDVISRSEEQVLCIRPTLSFRDGNIEKFDKLMDGVKASETRESKAKISADAPNESLRGKTITASFEVLEVKKLELPELTPSFLEELGGLKSEKELRAALKEELHRQLDYHQQQRARQQITQALVASANWELPPALLKRQGHRELERAVLELRRSGFSDDQIQAHENELRQNSAVSTARALKEHFILERIAESEKIEDVPADYESEIKLIAAQSGESARRVRAQLEKRGLMDVLRNQIIERKTIDLVLKHAKFKDVPFKLESLETEAVDESAGGGEGEEAIPEALQAGEAQPLREPQERVQNSQGGLPNQEAHRKDESMNPFSPASESPLRPIDPRLSYRDYQRQRMLTLGDLLLENRIILLQGEIYDGNASEVVMKLLYLQSENRRKDVHFYINSPGGSVTATMAIYDTMQILSCPVATYCVGLAASGGAVLLAGGSKGKRFALSHAKVMIHQPYGQVGGQVSDIEIQADEILKTRESLNQILANHTGQAIERIAKDTDRDRYLTAPEAKEYGLVDEVLSKPPVITDEDEDEKK